MRRGMGIGLLAMVIGVGGAGGAAASTQGGSSDYSGEPRVRTLGQIKESGYLVVLTRDAPTTHYISTNGDRSGLEYDLVKAFAEWLGVEARFREYGSVGGLLQALEAGVGDFAAAGLAVTAQRQRRFRFGPAYDRLTQQVVCRRDTVQPESLEELARISDVRVPAGSSHAELLAALERQDYPVPEWRPVRGVSSRALLRQVWQGEIPCTVAHSSTLAVSQRYYPELMSPMNLSRERDVAWALPPTNVALASAVRRWLEGYRASGKLASVLYRYHDFFDSFDYVNTQHLIRRSNERLPKYREWFRAAARKYDLSYALLVAQGYQESHWERLARSPTGVRGIMMLTRATAREMAVENRLNPRQSIFGGAKYMAEMKRHFSDIPEPDRTFFALAAYNIGRAHVLDAQRLARRKGMNPYHWRDVREMLPLLSEPEYYRTLRYGFARGGQPVSYVRRIREYHHVLASRIQ